MDYKEKVIAMLNSQELSKEQKEKLENIFPELKESEDERIRNGLINGFKECFKDCQYPKDAVKYWHNVEVHRILAWLEKQADKDKLIRELGEYKVKYTQKVLQEDLNKNTESQSQPKFKPGDWITDGHITCKVLSVTGKSYELHLYNDDYCHFETDVQSVDKHYRLWTIQDAKDGDVLANDHHILILKALGYDWSCNGTPNSVKAYCGIKPNGNFELDKDNWSFCGTLHIYPATKGQCGLLFSKMKEAGYEWDSEKKELKKFEPKTLDADDILPYLGNNQVQDILEDMGMLDDNGRCPHTAEEIFKAGMEYAFNLNREAASSVKLDVKNI